MIHNYFKIAWMNLKKNRFFPFINVFGLCAGLACCMLISSIGLFALVTFSTEQRIKETGVRKVLGASAGGIVTLLSKIFLKPAGIAIATTVAWYIMHQWLQYFAYRTGPNIFILAGTIAVVIVFVTISFQAIKAANANTVKSLQTE